VAHAAAGQVLDQKLSVSRDEVLAALAKAKSGLKSGEAAATPQPLIRAPGFSAVAGFRSGPTPAMIHEDSGEFLQIISGDGRFVVGGKLISERRTNATNLVGTGIKGGETLRLKPGDVVFVPAGTAHLFGEMGAGGLGFVSHRVPVISR
jgi:mannose-6-phosphate isomerase-like protein (cupin superfamily)